MNTRITAFSLFLAFGLAFAAIATRAQLPCQPGLTGEGQLAHHQEVINTLTEKLFAAYESGDKKQEENLIKQLEGYSNHREVTFSDEDRNKMEELAQRPEVKMIIEAIYLENRAEDTEQAHNFNMTPCFYYPNPMLQDYVNRLGQSLIPTTSSQFYAFRIVNDPHPDAWALSTGSIYITTGLMSELDNEAQLAYVLAHEIGHVEHRHQYMRVRGRVLEELLEVEKVRSARKKVMILGAVAAGVGAAAGAKGGGASGALLGASLGMSATALVGLIVERLRVPRFSDYPTSQEADADEFATHAVLEHNFDVREAPKVFLTLETSIHRDDRVGMGFHYGQVNNLVDRRQHVQALLTGALKADLEQRSKNGLEVSSPDFSLLISALKRDNGALAFDYDLFDEARQNLEDAIAVRSTDPRAHYYLGRVYKQTARTPAEEQKAMDHLVQAIRLDIGRSFYSEPHLDRALALLNQNDHTLLAEAQKEIKTYIELYKLNHGGSLPSNMYILYDYLSLTGDENWAKPPVLNVAQVVASEGAEATKPEVKEVKKESEKRTDQHKPVTKKSEPANPK
jgi:predicted Zn-dependent protease